MFVLSCAVQETGSPRSKTTRLERIPLQERLKPEFPAIRGDILNGPASRVLCARSSARESRVAEWVVEGGGCLLRPATGFKF